MSRSAAIPSRPIGASLGRFVIVGKTTCDEAALYPTVPAATYTIRLHKMVEPETEGAAPALIDMGQTDLAVNLGTTLPPPGTLVVLGKALSGRYIFNHNG